MNDDAPPPPPVDVIERRHWLTLLFTSLGVLMVTMDATIVNVALPVIRQDLGYLKVTVSELQWIVNAYALTFAVLLLMSGKLADLFGRKRLFLIGLVVFTGSSIACGVSGDINVLIGFRALQGIGAALVMPTTMSILQTTFPLSRLGTAIGIWSAVLGLGSAIGPLAGGLLAEDINWRWVFFINVPIGVIVVIGTLLYVRESKAEIEDRSLDYGGAALSAIALFLLTFGLLKANNYGWGDVKTIGAVGGGAIMLVLFVLYERTRRAPMVELSLFRSTAFTGANLLAVFVGFSLFGLLFYVSLFIEGTMGYSATNTGLAELPMTAFIMIGSPIVARQIGKFGTGPLLAIGMGWLAVAFALFSRLDFNSGFFDVLPADIAAGLGFAFAFTPLTAAALSAVPFQLAGVGAAVINSTRQIGGALGLAVLGAISAQQIAGQLSDGKAGQEGFVHAFGVLMITGAAVAALGAVVAWVTIARPARAAAKAAAAAAAAEPPPAEEAAPAPEELSVEYSHSWVVAAPSVVSARPAALALLAARAQGGRARLEVVAGPGAGTRIPIGNEPLVIGRASAGPGRLGDDAELSRRHASISVSGADGDLLVEDLASTNGTIVNGTRISEPTVARPGNTIELGASTLRVLAVPAAEAAGINGDAVVLDVIEGPAAGTSISIGAAPFVFGRAEMGSGNLGADPELSRRHASATLFAPGRLLVEDLGSTNGTYVNDHRIAAPTVVSASDGVKLGTSTIKVHAGAPDESLRATAGVDGGDG